MKRRRSRISASPVLVGAITVVIAVVAVFFSYNANKGLPFVPTYEVKADLPSAASLVAGNEVRIAGVRVGLISQVKAKQLDDGRSIAVATMKLDKSVEPIPEDSTVLVRQRSAMGLKYLLLTPGKSDQGLEPGGTLPESQAEEPVDMDQWFNMFQAPVRRAIQKNLAEYGGGLAARGADINQLIADLPPLLRLAEPVAKNLSSKQTDLRGFVRGLSQAAAEVAPVAETQADMFVQLDRTFIALAEVARPYIQDSITEGVPTELAVIRNGPRIRPFLYTSADFMKALKPGAKALGESAPIVSRSFDIGIPVLRSSPQLYDELAPTARSLRRFGESTSNNEGLDMLISTNEILTPLLRQVTPSQNTCNYLNLLLANVASATGGHNSEGNAVRAVSVLPQIGVNAEGNPASGMANGGTIVPPPDDPTNKNYLHSNPYPNTAAPGQSPRECEPGNIPEGWFIPGGGTTWVNALQVGNLDGDQGLITQDQTQAQLNWRTK
ncbi:MAG TPA: MlaD family protein [Solirubrobacterales bacterium]|nr:MlaD family protein [Solirubrobacterales bacterium]HMX72333.1 MlaD family protein [Solirubrobacterales bacterium]HNA45292.1 MlaD family protein [Solirubrobacterales bacterium]HNE78866.1 MlaD family protein [Solirubrobacterales bacterium]HNF84034.1 MlaD family protein [Solirubrobacterales bacterium]